jgi:uncharacterized protein YdhG (YjbR/CyaY superfamily)
MDSTRRKPKTIDEYLADVDADHCDALQKLRETIHTVAPTAEECISYGIPAFRLNGHSLVFFGMGQSLRVLSGEFQHVEKIPERAKEFSNQQRHASLLSRQTGASRIGEEAA